MEKELDNNKEIENVKENKQEEKKEKIKQEQKSKKGFCIAALVLGIISLVLFCMWYISIPCGILAVIFGITGIKSTDKGMAIAGLVTGAITLSIMSIIISWIMTIAIAIGFSEEFEDEIYDRDYNSYHHEEEFDIYE